MNKEKLKEEGLKKYFKKQPEGQAVEPDQGEMEKSSEVAASMNLSSDKVPPWAGRRVGGGTGLFHGVCMGLFADVQLQKGMCTMLNINKATAIVKDNPSVL